MHFKSPHKLCSAIYRYYVEIQAYPAENRDVLIGMAQHVEGMLPGQNAPPSELNYLPAESRVPGTEMYITSGILGHGFLDRGLVCKYLVDGEEVMAFVVLFPSVGDAGKALESYKRYLENGFRKYLRLEGTPIRIEFKGGDNPFAGKRNTLTPRQMHKRKRMVDFINKRERKKDR